MTSDVRIALAQIAPRLGDVDANLTLHRDAVARARSQGADVVAFPELSLTGYLLQDRVPDVAMPSNDERLSSLSRDPGGIDVILGFVEETREHLFYNSAAYLSDGVPMHVHRKLYLPSYGMFDEGRDFAAGARLRVFESRWGAAGLLVCEDLWHPTSAWLLAMQGAQWIVVLSNGPAWGGGASGPTSDEVWRQLAQVTARLCTCHVVYVNRAGGEDGISFGGGSLVVDPAGELIGELPALEETVQSFTLSAEALRVARSRYPLLRDANLDLVARELERLRGVQFGLDEDTTLLHDEHES